MKILMVNKFLYPNGGAETYMFRLGAYLQQQGHKVAYFGMEHEGRCVSNPVGAYTTEMDFHNSSTLQKLTYPLRTIYSAEARKKLRLVLENFRPDVVHLNNFNYQLTPSVILEVASWRKQHPCRLVYTAHDYQLVCPNHMLYNPNSETICEQCLDGRFSACLKGKCIHGSSMRSAIGMAEATFWNGKGTYGELDTVICCSAFLKTRLDSNSVLAKKTVTIHNFVDPIPSHSVEKKDYILYFGRYAQEKGIGTLLEVCRSLPDIPFVFAGGGPLEAQVGGIPNVKNVGFQSGEALETLIREARLSIYPSEWYENCPLSVMESQRYGTPVLGADIGGIPELIAHGKTGELFESGNGEALQQALRRLWAERDTTLRRYGEACAAVDFETVQSYTEKLMKLYGGVS